MIIPLHFWHLFFKWFKLLKFPSHLYFIRINVINHIAEHFPPFLIELRVIIHEVNI